MSVGLRAEGLTDRQARTLDEAVAVWRPKIEGKVVVVTGAARGLGRAIALYLAAAGARIAATDRSWKGAEDLEEALRGANPAAPGVMLEMDVTDGAAIARVRSEVEKRFETIDALVNNAGIVSETLFPPTGAVKTLDTSDDDWETMFRTNLFGTLKVIRRFIEPMLRRERGSIINVVSSGVLHSSTGGAYFAARPWTVEMPYQASKAALTALTFYLAEEVQGNHVNVNALMPGHTRASWFDATARAFLEQGHAYTMRPVVPEHVVPLVFFLIAQADRGDVTGRLYDVSEWNYDHGYGGVAAWRDQRLPADLDAAYRKVEAFAPPSHRSGAPRPSFETTSVLGRVVAKIVAAEREAGRRADDAPE